jgi:hypothetical protein
VVRRLIGQVEDLVDDRRLPLRAHVLEGHLLEDPRAQLGALGGREDPLAGLDPRQQPVSLEHLGGKRVVVQDGGLLALGQLQRGQGAADHVREMLRGLVGEGEAQDVSRQHSRV